MPTRMSPGCSQAQRCSLGAILNCPTWGEEDRAFKGLKSSLISRLAFMLQVMKEESIIILCYRICDQQCVSLGLGSAIGSI